MTGNMSTLFYVTLLWQPRAAPDVGIKRTIVNARRRHRFHLVAQSKDSTYSDAMNVPAEVIKEVKMVIGILRKISKVSRHIGTDL